MVRVIDRIEYAAQREREKLSDDCNYSTLNEFIALIRELNDSYTLSISETEPEHDPATRIRSEDSVGET